MQTEITHTRLSTEVKKALEELAEKEDRTVSFMIRTAVMQMLRRRGFLQEEDYR